MRKFFGILAIAIAFVATFSSCDKEEKGGDNDIIGTWLMRADEYHYFDATFKKDGSYEWMWKGASGRVMDKGSYTYENNVITMTPQKFYEEDYDSKELKEQPLSNVEWSGPRKVTVVENLGGVAFWRWKGDFMIDDSDWFRGNEGEPVTVFKEGYNVKVKESDLKGTWEMQDADEYRDIFTLGDKTYSWYSIWPEEDAECGLSVRKETGTWSFKGNVLTFVATKQYNSFKSLGYNKETQKNEYIYYNVNPETFEADQWESYNLDYTLEYYFYLADGKLTLPIAVYVKKK